MSGHAPSKHPMSVPHPDIVAQLNELMTRLRALGQARP